METPVQEKIEKTGEPPVQPIDEKIEWARAFTSAGFKVDKEKDRADYREHETSQNVVADEPLARIIPATPGRPGVDDSGKTIAVRKPKKVNLRAGKNVRFDEQEGCFYAETSGRFHHEGDVISIEEVYEVRGSVGIETGNIRFTGFVSVGGDVEDVATVEAGTGLEVKNVIGAADVRCGGNIVVGRGIAGREKGKVFAAGTIEVGYITNAYVEARKGIIVRKEVRHSTLHCNGSISVETGRIVGGKTVALGEIVVSEAGAEAAPPTLLIAGEDYTLPPFLAEKELEIRKLEYTHKKIKDQIDPLMKQMRQLKPEQREAVTELMYKAQEIEEQIKSIEKEVDDRQKQSELGAGKQIRVLKIVHPRVTFRIHGVELLVKKIRRGPMTAILNDAGEIQII